MVPGGAIPQFAGLTDELIVYQMSLEFLCRVAELHARYQRIRYLAADS